MVNNGLIGKPRLATLFSPILLRVARARRPDLNDGPVSTFVSKRGRDSWVWRDENNLVVLGRLEGRFVSVLPPTALDGAYLELGSFKGLPCGTALPCVSCVRLREGVSGAMEEGHEDDMVGRDWGGILLREREREGVLLYVYLPAFANGCDG